MIVLNFHGGIPTSMIQKALKQLPNFASLAKESDMYTRVYPSNAAASPALHDIVMDVPLGSMTDSIWHDWCFVRKATRSIFNVFQQNGYTTNLFGTFGLERKLDPHNNMYNYPGDCKKSLEILGIDEFETQDVAFTCQYAFAQDKQIMNRACCFFETMSSLNFTMINLLGAHDIHKCNFSKCDCDNVVVPVVGINEIESWSKKGLLPDLKPQDVDSRHYSKNVLHDNPRSKNTNSSNIEGLRRAVMLYDWLRGRKCESNESTNEVLENVSEMHKFAWKCLINLDESIGNMIDVLKKRNLFDKTIIYMTCDHPISLLEHGEICEAPWDACLRSFLMVRYPYQAIRRENDEPVSLAHLPCRIMKDCHLFEDWHTKIPPSCVLTLGISPSWVCRAFLPPQINVFAFKALFMRFVVNRFGRLYSVVVWFSIHDLFVSTDITYVNMSDDVLADLCHHNTEWVNPITEKDFVDLSSIQVYDLTTDSSEIHNLVTPEWLKSNAAESLKNDINYTIKAYELDTLKIIFPKHIHTMSPDKITFASIQHHKIQDRLQLESKIMKSISVQTEDMSIIRLLGNEFGKDCELLFKNKITNSYKRLTIFVPEQIRSTWPEWLANPMSGLLTKELLTVLAESNVEMFDIHNNRVNITNKLDSSVVVQNSVIFSNELSFMTLNVHALVYKVKPLRISGINHEPSNINEKIEDKKEEIYSEVNASQLPPKKLKSSRYESGKKNTSEKPNDIKDKGKAKTYEMRVLQKEAYR